MSLINIYDGTQIKDLQKYSSEIDILVDQIPDNILSKKVSYNHPARINKDNEYSAQYSSLNNYKIISSYKLLNQFKEFEKKIHPNIISPISRNIMKLEAGDYLEEHAGYSNITFIRAIAVSNSCNIVIENKHHDVNRYHSIEFATNCKYKINKIEKIDDFQKWIVYLLPKIVRG